MSSITPLMLAMVGGMGVGVLHFAWLGVDARRLARLDHTVWQLLSGLGLRLVIALALLWLLGGGEADRLVAALAGFLAARVAMMRQLGPTVPSEGGGKPR